MNPTPAPEAPPAPACYRHAQRETYIRCTRCDRHICPDCMREAPVGHQCPDCVRAGHQGMREARTVFGARTGAGPVLTYLLIALNVLAYLLELARPDTVDRYDNLGQGLLGPDGKAYVFQGAGVPLPPGFHLSGVAHGEWYRLITSAFLHQPPGQGTFGILHILMNMYSLWLFGRVMEVQLGRIRFLALYLLSAVGGSVLGYLISPTEAALGASGAIFGLVGAYFLMTRRMHSDPLGGGRQLIASVIWLVASAGITSWQGHLGGLLTGLLLGTAFVFAPRKARAAVQVAAVLAVGALLVGGVLYQTAALTG
ncbi:rhomboid family intramembrane serine protease [Kitasatospora viridis]|uniref:Membrane associated rhomboid family serine protease n=1 Tax=Kitasatospora viridis TaxID=281105 RepID=A0A561UL98_9ACTN|nr:rhomboid family intramembrane serine protease [Kitasatospora viridis]TWG00141.1 membrane associated rhomboid family serine protease [Kitasatospora viridis]